MTVQGICFLRGSTRRYERAKEKKKTAQRRKGLPVRVLRDRTAEEINHKSGKKVFCLAEQSFMRVEEVAQELGVSKSYAYKIVQKLNQELKEKGIPTISGRVNRKYFQEKPSMEGWKGRIHNGSL